MGRHRTEAVEPPYHVPAAGGARRRRRWPVAAFVAVLLILGGWFVWSRSQGTGVAPAASSNVSCPAGDESVQIAVSPSIANAVGLVVSAYLRAKPVVTDHCVSVAISAVDPKTVLTGLAHSWDTNMLGPKPDAWIADSTLWSNQLPADSIGDPPQSVATSPVVLAMPSDAAKAVVSASAPTFAGLPALVSLGDGWSGFGKPAWGRFSLALPDLSANSASMLAVAAMVDPATPQGQPPVTAGLLNSDVAAQKLANLAAAQPTPMPTTSHQALVSLGGADGVQHAPCSAVPVTEVDLYERNLGMDGDVKPLNVLGEVRLSGVTPYADFPFTPLAGGWVTSDLVAAAENFRDFLLTAPQQAQLAKGGFRVADSFAHPDPSPGMDWGGAARGSTPTDAASYRQLVAAWQSAGQSAH